MEKRRGAVQECFKETGVVREKGKRMERADSQKMAECMKKKGLALPAKLTPKSKSVKK